MENKEFKKDVCENILELTGIKYQDVMSISSNNSNKLYIELKNNRRYILTIEEEYETDTNLDYEFEYTP